jgi:RHS repeat-associated protein
MIHIAVSLGRLRSLLLWSAIFASLQTNAGAQNTSLTDGQTPPGMKPGAPAGSYLLSGLDTVNLFNGNLNFSLPLLQVGGRGEAQHMIKLMLERHWRIERYQTCLTCPAFDYPVDTSWSTLRGTYGPGFMEGRVSEEWIACPVPPLMQDVRYNYTRLTFTTPDGTEHELVDKLTGGALLINNQNCTESPRNKADSHRGKVFKTRDGSSMTFISDSAIYDTDYYLTGVNNLYPTGNLFMKDGTRYRIESGLVKWIRDRNGNKLTFFYDGNSRVNLIVDSLKREVNIIYPDTSGVPYDQIKFRGSGGVWRVIKVYHSTLQDSLHAGYTIKTARQLFEPDLDTPDDSPYNPLVVAGVELPNGTLYRFFYNSYGELAKVNLPTGGGIEYRFGSGISTSSSGVYNIMVFRRLIERTIYRDAATIEGWTSYQANDIFSPGNTIAIVDHLDANDSRLSRDKHTFFGKPTDVLGRNHLNDPPPLEGREELAEEFDSNGTTLLRKTTNTWITSPYGFPRISQTVTTLLDTNQVSKQTFSHDQFNNRTEINEYDFGTGAAGSLLRTKTNTYATTLNGFDYAGTNITDSTTPDGVIHLRGLPLQQSVFNGGAGEESRTTYEYDNYNFDANHAPLEPRSGISGRLDPDIHTAAYVPRGNVTAISRRLLSTGSEIRNYQQYDIAGNVVRAIDGRGHQTRLFYADNFGVPEDREARTNSAPAELAGASSFAFPTSVINALSHTRYSQYDYYLGRPVDQEDENGLIISSYYYDLLDRVKHVVRRVGSADHSVTTFSYDDTNRVIATTSDLNTLGDQQLRTDILYDGMGRTVETRKYESGGGYIATRQTYDAMGRTHEVSNPYRPLAGETLVWTKTAYDALGRVTRVTLPGSAVMDSLYSGNEVLVVDPAEKMRTSKTDALGRLVRVIEDSSIGGLGYQTDYQYDALDNLIRVQQGGQTRSFVYDSLGRLTSATNPESGSVSYFYDNNGNLIQKIDPRGIATTYNYDTLNRLTGRSYTDSTPAVTFGYDSAAVANSKGRLTSVSSSVSSYGYDEYDRLGRVQRSSQVTAGQQYLMSYGYDLAGNLTSQSYPSGRIATTTYDTTGRISGVTGYVSSITYAPHGAVKTMLLGNGLWEHAIYNERLQPTRIGLGISSTSTSVLGLDYNYGTTANNGNVLVQAITAPGLSVTQIYTYDSLNRLKTAAESAWSQAYEYDQWGNRSLIAGAYSPSDPALTPRSQSQINAANNRITGESWVYDSAGNLLTDGAGNTFTYDAENRQTSFNGTAASYGYDGEGRRVKKVESGVLTTFVYNALGKLIAEYGPPPAPGTAGRRYLTTDHLGSTRVVTDASKAVTSRHDYLPFGEEITVGTGGRTSSLGYGAAGPNLKFTGKERDSESGLDYFGARYMSGAQGRFTSPDAPFADQQPGDPQSWNLYIYVRNNPLALVDEDGFEVNTAARARALQQIAAIAAQAKGGTLTLGFLGINSGERNYAKTKTAQTITGYSGLFGLGELDKGNTVPLPNENFILNAAFGQAGVDQVDTAVAIFQDAKAANVTVQIFVHSNGVNAAGQFAARLGEEKLANAVVIAPNTRSVATMNNIVNKSADTTIVSSPNDDRLKLAPLQRRSPKSWANIFRGNPKVKVIQTNQRCHGAQCYLEEIKNDNYQYR